MNLSQFKGLPYRWWKPGFDIPIYNIDTLPSTETLKKQGLWCSGLLNVIMLSTGNKAIGGTEAWYKYLITSYSTYNLSQNNDMLVPKGSIVFSNYENEDKQGYIAIITSDNKSIEKSTILHCVGREKITDELYGPGVIEESIKPTLFSHVCIGTSWNKKFM